MKADERGHNAWLLLTLAIILMPLVIYYAPCLSGQGSFFVADITYYFQPFLTFISTGLRRGELPLWNPWMYCGMPQYAVPSPGIFYPLNFPFYCLPFSPALAVFLIVHQLIAGLGAFLLVMSMRWGGFSAMLAALAFAWGGYMFSMTSNFTLMATITWLPLALFFLRRVQGELNTRNILAVMGTAASVAMMMAAGRPEVSVPAVVVVAVFAVADVVARYRDDRSVRAAGNQLAWRLAAGVLAVMWSLPVVLPAMEWAKLSPRAAGLDPKYVFIWSANWYDWLCIVLPQPLGDVSALGSKFLNLTASRSSTIPYLPSAFVGPVILVMAIWGMFDRTWSGRWLTMSIAVGTGILALGKFTPLAPLVVSFSPALSAFRYPVKLMIIPVMCLILFAARGAYLALLRNVSPVSLITSGAVCLLGFLVGVTFVCSPGLSEIAFTDPYFSTRARSLAVLTEAQIILGYSLVAMSVIGAGICLLYFSYQRRKLSTTAFCGVVIFVEALLLLYAPTHYNRHFTAGDFFDRPVPLAQEMIKLAGCQPDGSFDWRVQCLTYDPLENPGSFPADQNLPFVESFYQYGRQLLITNTHLPFGLPYSSGYEAAETGTYKEWWDRAVLRSSQNRFHDFTRHRDTPLSNFFRYTSTRYCWTQSWIKWQPRRTIPVLNPKQFRVLRDDVNFNLRTYQCLDPHPRVHFVTRIRLMDSVRDTIETILDAPDAETTYIEKTEADLDGISKCSLVNQPGDTVSMQPQGTQTTVVRTKTSATRLMVLNDNFYKGWSADLDGQPVTISRANIFARAVVVPPGEHVVTFRFSSPSLNTAACVFAAGLIAVLLLLGFTYLRRR